MSLLLKISCSKMDLPSFDIVTKDMFSSLVPRPPLAAFFAVVEKRVFFHGCEGRPGYDRDYMFSASFRNVSKRGRSRLEMVLLFWGGGGGGTTCIKAIIS